MACQNPGAVNYDPTGVEDYSCLYLFKRDGICHLFKDILPEQVEDQSFTLSYSTRSNGWVFFHDYVPDLYVHTREELYNLKDNVMFKHHQGPAGVYHGPEPKPFFIDIIFRNEGDMLLESVQWVTEFLQNKKDKTYETLSHISIWNSRQHTGRLGLDQIFANLQYPKMRRTHGAWSLNAFRDVLVSQGVPFIRTIFNNFALDTNQTGPELAWYNKQLMQDNWFCVRFEYDNQVAAKVIIHDTTVQAQITDR